MLLLGGALAIYLGVDELKDTWKEAETPVSDPEPSEDVEKYKAEIDELKEEIENSEALSPELQEELVRQLDELAQELRKNPGDREKALADLSKMEEELRTALQENRLSFPRRLKFCVSRQIEPALYALNF